MSEGEAHAWGGQCGTVAGDATGAGAEDLLDVFDVMRAEHEGMNPREFNSDTTYKARINQVREERALRRAGAA